MNAWIEVETLRTISRHTISVVAVVVSFGIVGWVMELLIPKGPLRSVLEWVEEFVIIGSFGWLVVEYAAMFWRKRVWKRSWNGQPSIVLA
jgi:hypothetical protein